jgi:phospholipase/carboxylesterase
MSDAQEMKPVTDLPLTHLLRPPRVAPPAGERSPLLALAHGVGSNEQDLFSFAEELDPRFVVVSARAPITRAPGSYAWFDVQFLANGSFAIAPEQLEASRNAYAAFVRAAADAYGADPARIYTLGFSQGAIISLVTALTNHKLFAGVIAMSGRIPPEAEPWLPGPAETAGLPVFQSHGTLDTVIKIEYARSARAILERQRVDLSYHEYRAAHTINKLMFDDMTSWLTVRLG